MRNAVRLGRLFGIELRVDSSWLFIFALVIWSLSSLFGIWHPEWAISTRMVVATFAALAFFASVLFHELAHSLVARAYGIPVRDITLHMFGGVSNIEREPPTPGSEFLIAIVGPLASIGLGIVLMIGGAAIANLGGAEVETAADVVARMGPLMTLIMWLGPVNVTVGVFNLIPGFPLDGGRILRSILWKLTGSLHTATRWSTVGGQLVGWGFITMGVFMALGYPVPFFGRGLTGGIWLALIGLFLRNAAVQQYAGSAVSEALDGVRVTDLMRKQGPWVYADIPVRTLVEHWLMRHEERAFPVFVGAEFVGVVGIDDVQRLARADWDATTVREVMTPLERLTVTSPDKPMIEALRALGASDRSELPVVAGDQLVGMLFETDVARWLELQTAERRPRRPMRPRTSHA